MRRELKNIAEYKKPSNDAFASVVRSFEEANSRFQALAVESVGRAVDIQSQFVGKAYDTYISEISKLGRMFFVGYRTFTARPQELPHANLNEKAADRPQAQLAEAKVNPDPARRRSAAQSMTTKRKAETVAKSQSGERSTKAKRKVGSVRRGKS
jgi:type IV secretory pathway VirB10-like protein